MKRGIKFRAYSHKYKKIFPVNSIEFIDKIEGRTGLNILIDGKKLEWLDSFKGEYDLMQFTGMSDKNGNEIYEGDIVKWEDEYRMREKSGISKIIWEGQGFNISGSDFGYEGEDLIGWENLEVIGNIYENKNLLQ